MAQTVSENLLFRFSEFLTVYMGLYFPKERWRDLERGIRSAAREFDFQDDVESCIRWLISSSLSKNQIEILAGHLAVGETYFFREKNSFEILRTEIFPDLIRSRLEKEKRLRIWSAGCCTGEEPYSIAMLLDQMIPDLRDWNITILATDINPRFIQKASEGVYGEWSFRDVPPWIKEKYFKRKKQGYFEIFPYLKKMVMFSYLNLAEDAYPSLTNNTNAMDLIFCRNVLMYFSPERVKKTIHNLYRSLLDGGWLIVSPTETSHILFSKFAAANFPGMTLYRKDGEMPEKAEAFSSRVAGGSNVFFQAPHVSLAEPQPGIPSSCNIMEILPLDVKKPETEESRPSLFMEAQALYDQSQHREAEGKLVLFLSQNREDATAMAFLAKVYANQGKLVEAFEWCEKALAVDRLNPGYHYLAAIILQELGRNDEAVMSLKRALYLDQDFVLAHFALGNISRKQGRFKESAKHFENTLSLLSGYQPETIVPESDGMTAGRLMETITVYRDQGAGIRERVKLAPVSRTGF